MDTLLWIDVETTGLDPDSDALLEIGMLYTDGGLHPIDAPLDLVLRWDGTPDDFIKGMHGPNGLLDACRGRGYTKEAVTLASDAFLRCEGLPYLILTAADGDGPAFRVAEKCGFLLYERRVRVGRRLTGMPGEAYAYFRKY